MGGGTWDAGTWSAYASRSGVSSAASASGIYHQSHGKDEFLPVNITLRESRDSDDHPLSTPIILALDVTGSMSPILTSMAKTVLPTIMNEIYDKKPVTDPQIMCMGVGDAFCDSTPLQCTQFESDIRVSEQLAGLYFEQGGGGNSSEGYILPWWFAANRCECDAFEKRGVKGFLFTMGDDGPTPEITVSHLKNVFGVDGEAVKAEDLLVAVSRKWEVYHFLMRGTCEPTSYEYREWKKLLGERAIPLIDPNKMGEVITSILELSNGKAVEEILDGRDNATALVISKAIAGLTKKATAAAGVKVYR